MHQVLARKQLEATINEKSILEQTFRANEHGLQEILDTMAEGVIIVDEHCRPTYSNLMAQKIMATSDQEFKARSYNDSKWQNESIDGTRLPIDEHPMCKALRTGKAVYDHEIAITLPSGAKIYITINAAPLLDERECITGGIATVADVTRRRKILEQKEDLISVASHELKTPVTALKTTLQLLERMKDNISLEMLAKLVAQSNKSMNKLSELVEHLLNSNRISQGRFPVNKPTFSITDLIEDCCQHVRTTGSHDIVETFIRPVLSGRARYHTFYRAWTKPLHLRRNYS